MKKVALIFASLLVISVAFSSCKSKELCPAYTKANSTHSPAQKNG